MVTSVVFLLLAIIVMPVMAGGRQQDAAGKIAVRYVCLVKGIPYFDPIIKGLKEVVEAQGGIFRDTAPDQSDAVAQIALVEAAIQDKVNVILVSPSAPDTLNTAFDKARAAGIKVLCVNDDILGNESHRDAAVLACDYDQLAADSFVKFAEAMNYRGKFVALSSKSDTPFQNNQIEIYRKIMAGDAKYKDMQLVEVLYGNDEVTKSLTEAEVAIQKYPDLAGIIAPTTIAVIAAAQAVENAGLGDKVVVYGLGTPNQSREFLKSGVLDGAMLWDTYRQGKVAGHLAMLMARGEFTPSPGASFNAGEYGPTKVLSNNVIYGGPPAEFTKANVDTYDF
jgi:rhamnose transport system substrate-binding protein